MQQEGEMVNSGGSQSGVLQVLSSRVLGGAQL